MSCNDIASILDTHRSTRLAPAERAAIDAHLVACADCAAAWHAHTELLALRVPPMPATLLERALLASRLPPERQAAQGAHGPSRRQRAAGRCRASRRRDDRVDDARAVGPSRLSSADDTVGTATDSAQHSERVARERRSPCACEPQRRTADVRRARRDRRSASLPLVRHPPDYPPDALSERPRGATCSSSST